MNLKFDWDRIKAQDNLVKHAVSFGEAATAFGDPLSVIIPDVLHSDDEERRLLLGLSVRRRLLVVVHTDRDDITRLISARVATAKERRSYEGEQL